MSDRGGGYRDVATANDVRLAQILRDYFGIDVPDEEGISMKTWCPFSFEHIDGGLERNFRVYPRTNSAMCFVMHGSMNPVGLIMVAKDLRPFDAAKEILQRYGLKSYGPYEERFAEVALARAERTQALGNTANLVEALHIAAGDAAGDMGRLDSVLEELDALMARSPSPAELRGWFERAKESLAGGE